MSSWHDLRIDGDRLWQRLEALGEIGAVHGPNGERGCARLALTDADREGRDLVVSWMRDLGLRRLDRRDRQRRRHPCRQRSHGAAVMVGSHIDTVRTGGRFDGNLGVLAGLEIVETLAQHDITTRRPIQVAFFTDEEGARFAPDMLGSLVYVGGLAVEEALDVTAADDGARLGDELTRIGYAGPTPVPAASFPYTLRRAAHRTGPGARGRRHHHRRRHRRAGHLVDRGDGDRAVRPRRHDTDADAPRPAGGRGAMRSTRSA